MYFLQISSDSHSEANFDSNISQFDFHHTIVISSNVIIKQCLSFFVGSTNLYHKAYSKVMVSSIIMIIIVISDGV